MWISRKRYDKLVDRLGALERWQKSEQVQVVQAANSGPWSSYTTITIARNQQIAMQLDAVLQHLGIALVYKGAVLATPACYEVVKRSEP